jgi:hypothetical protein
MLTGDPGLARQPWYFMAARPFLSLTIFCAWQHRTNLIQQKTGENRPFLPDAAVLESYLNHFIYVHSPLILH